MARGGIRHLGVLASSAVLILGAVAACDSSGGMDDVLEVTTSPDGLVIWADETHLEALDAAAQDFEERTGTPVDLVEKSWLGIRSDLLADVPEGDGPDIAFGAHDWVPELVAAGVVSEVAETDADQAATAAFEWQGGIYGVPVSVSNVALIRNTALAPQAPETWDDLIAAGTGSEYPLLVPGAGPSGDPLVLYPLQASFGATLSQGSDDVIRFDFDRGGSEFAYFLADAGADGLFDPELGRAEVLEAFTAQQSPFLIGDPAMAREALEAGVPVAVEPIPGPGGQQAVPLRTVTGAYLSSGSQNPEAAVEFLQYLATSEVQVDLAGNAIPANRDAARQAATSDPLVSGFQRAGQNAVATPTNPAFAQVWGIWGRTEAAIIADAVNDPAAAWAQLVVDAHADLGDSAT